MLRDWASTQYNPQAAVELARSCHPIGRMADIKEIGVDGGAPLGYRR